MLHQEAPSASHLHNVVYCKFRKYYVRTSINAKPDYLHTRVHSGNLAGEPLF